MIPSFSTSSCLTTTVLDREDEDLVGRANEFVKEEQLLRAARLLRMVRDPSALSESHKKLLCNAEIIECVAMCG